MFTEVFFYLILVLISFIPIIIWGYLFSYLDDSNLNRSRFFLWIFAWWISVFPILYMPDILKEIDIGFLNIFDFVSNITWIFSIFSLIISLFLVFLILSFIPFLIFNLKFSFTKVKEYIKTIFIFMIWIVLLWFVFYFLYLLSFLFPFLNTQINYQISFWDVLFNSILLVIFYYFLISFIEEISKFFCFKYSSSFSITSVKVWVLYAIFVALGFSFIENILYFKNLYINYWLSSELISSFFFRNIFSVVLHVFCSSIFAYYFSYAIVNSSKKIDMKFIKLIIIGFFISIIMHSIFNIFLTFNFLFIIFIYLIISYFYITNLFYRE